MLPPFLSWYRTSILSRTLVIEIITTNKSSGDSESPWKIPLLMLTSADLVPELVRIVFQLGIVFLRNLIEESDGVFLCTIYIFPGILSAMSVVSCRRPSYSLSMPYSGWVFCSCCSSSPFCQSALPSTAFLLVRYGVCLSMTMPVSSFYIIGRQVIGL